MVAALVTLLTSGAFWWTFIGISAIPYALYGVAYVFESRHPGNGPNDVPVWKDQSRAFMPGGFGLALMVAVCLQYHSQVKGWTTSPWVAVFAGLIGVGMFVVARTYEIILPYRYLRTAWLSPSKRYYDFVTYLLFPFAFIDICLPVYLAASWTMLALVNLLGLLGLAVWVLGVVDDEQQTHSTRTLRFPMEYRPIWQRDKTPSPST